MHISSLLSIEYLRLIQYNDSKDKWFKECELIVLNSNLSKWFLLFAGYSNAFKKSLILSIIYNYV